MVRNIKTALALVPRFHVFIFSFILGRKIVNPMRLALHL